MSAYFVRADYIPDLPQALSVNTFIPSYKRYRYCRLIFAHASLHTLIPWNLLLRSENDIWLKYLHIGN